MSEQHSGAIAGKKLVGAIRSSASLGALIYPRGDDGVSPVISVEAIHGGHRVTVTDADGVKTFPVLDGRDGDSGADPIIAEETGTVISVSDAADRAFSGLNLFGKTIQNGTPAPDAPIPLESVGDGGAICVNVTGKNLARPRPTVTETVSGITSTFEADGVLLINGSTAIDYNNAYYMPYLASHGGLCKLPAGTYTVSFEQLGGVLTGASFLLAYRGKSNAASTFKALTGAVTLAFDEETGISVMVQFRTGGTADNVRVRFQIEAGSAATAYEPYVEQTISVPTPDGLPGIPVDDGWIADEIDLGRGVYVQRVKRLEMNGAEDWMMANTIKGVNILYLQPIFPLAAAEAGLCTHFPYDQKKAYGGQEGYIGA
jgi:hypothetical protein